MDFLKTLLFIYQKATWIFLIVIFILALLLTEKYSQSFHFVDEDEHFVVGSFMIQGYHLYSNLSANHQPLTYLSSALAQWIFQPKTLFTLFKTGRETIFIWGLLGGAWLTLQYGFIALPFILFYECTKYFLFGNLFLSESLVIYPLVYLLGECYKITFYSYSPKNWQVIGFALATFFISFNLLPMLPVLLLLGLIYLIKIKQKKLLILSLIIPTVLLFFLISPLDYFRETVYYNWKYTLPYLSPIGNKYYLLKLLIFPLLSFFASKNSILNQWIILFTIIFIINLLIYLINNRVRYLIGYLLFYLLIVLTNNRNLVPGEMFYSGFHLLPWYAAFIFFNLLNIKLIFKKNIKFKFLPVLILVTGSLYLMISSHMPYFESVNKLNEHNTNFLPYYLIEQGLKTLVKEGDRLMVLPDETIVYWNSGVKPATNQLIYHNWEYEIPLLRMEMNKVLATDSPEFIYANFDRIGTAGYLSLIIPLLKTQYWQVNVNGAAQNLHIKRTKIKTISEEQWKEWEKLSFDRIKL